MKKTIITSIALASLATGISLYSCKKEEIPQQQNPATVLNVSVKNDLLVFKTTDDYREIVDNSSQEEKIKFTENVKSMNAFSSYYEYYSAKNPSVLSDASAIEVDFLQTILNKDAAVQIGDYIYKINKAQEKVFALHVSYSNEYNDVVSGNTSNPNILEFSTSDDVLDLIEQQGGIKAINLLCSESGIGSRHEDEEVEENGVVVSYAYAHYTRAGIHFSLYAQIDPVPSNTFTYSFEFTGGVDANAGQVYYHVRCKNTVDYQISSVGYHRTNTKQEYGSYEGTRSLNKVYFYYRVKKVSTGQYLTPYVGFRQNY